MISSWVVTVPVSGRLKILCIFLISIFVYLMVLISVLSKKSCITLISWSINKTLPTSRKSIGSLITCVFSNKWEGLMNSVEDILNASTIASSPTIFDDSVVVVIV